MQARVPALPTVQERAPGSAVGRAPPTVPGWVLAPGWVVPWGPVMVLVWAWVLALVCPWGLRWVPVQGWVVPWDPVTVLVRARAAVRPWGLRSVLAPGWVPAPGLAAPWGPQWVLAPGRVLPWDPVTVLVRARARGARESTDPHPGAQSTTSPSGSPRRRSIPHPAQRTWGHRAQPAQRRSWGCQRQKVPTVA